jgi:hypothetical protein
MQEDILIGEIPNTYFGDRRTKVWLECNGEPYDFRALQAVRITKIADEIELVKFACPRCGERHQSFRFV